jgi:hypothetical protein
LHAVCVYSPRANDMYTHKPHHWCPTVLHAWDWEMQALLAACICFIWNILRSIAGVPATTCDRSRLAERRAAAAQRLEAEAEAQRLAEEARQKAEAEASAAAARLAAAHSGGLEGARSLGSPSSAKVRNGTQCRMLCLLICGFEVVHGGMSTPNLPAVAPSSVPVLLYTSCTGLWRWYPQGADGFQSGCECFGRVS